MWQLCKRDKVTRKITYKGSLYENKDSLQILIDYWNASHNDESEEMYMRKKK